ncbi:putative membrane protein [Pedobacter cryoconitis]|uniref:Putative membrane protein n=1 Tax=Pedobacter cryoconitis TaxID=188932 RepID=A0A7W8ZQ38_9SPHI|nr:DUF1003 domain-containing protein [Pedobacter cryoconitis]MBB5638129.1 putative membrane protein [Pedobacter cryoconitis]
MDKLTKEKPDLKNFQNDQMISKKKSDRFSFLITNTFGSIVFLFICILFFVIWICWNLGLLPSLKVFDPFPFQALEMVVSIFAVILSVTVLISQKRQARMESIRQQVEFEVNIHAEKEITKMLEMLHDIQKKLGIDHNDTEQLERMKEELDIEKLHEQAKQGGKD